MSWGSASYDTKTLREDRHASEENFVAEATRRRRRSSLTSFFLISQEEAFAWQLLKRRHCIQYNRKEGNHERAVRENQIGGFG